MSAILLHILEFLLYLLELVYHVWVLIDHARIRRRLRRRGWPPETVYRLSSFGDRLKHWRRVPRYEQIAVIPWQAGNFPPGLMADSPFTWKDPEAMLWATLRLLEVQRKQHGMD